MKDLIDNVINRIKKIGIKKTIIIAIIILFIIIIVLALINAIEDIKLKKSVEEKEYTNFQDFESVKEVAVYMGCKYISQNGTIIYINFNKDLYDENGISNKKFFDNLSGYMSYVLNYEDFTMIDKSRKINIDVKCKKQQKVITKIIINGKEDYYNDEELKQQIEKNVEIPITKMQVNSIIINNLIKNKWNISSINLGSKESTFNKYNIYFDEGLEVRNLGNKIFNVIFTENYKDTVINNIKVGEKFENIEEILGKPTFQDQDIIGYKGKDIYVFFEQSTISIYRVEEYDDEKFTELLNKLSEFENIQKISNELTDIWSNYDKSEDEKDDFLRRYSLQGVELVSNLTKQGIILYNNFSGKVKDNKTINEINLEEIPAKVYIDNENDLVFISEKNRLNILQSEMTRSCQERMAYDEKHKLNDLSTKFDYYIKNNNNSKIVRFFSKDNKYPKCELEADINSYMWFDDYKFIYSVKNEGIYVYDLQSRNIRKLTEGKDEFIFTSFESKTLIYDNDKKLNFK